MKVKFTQKEALKMFKWRIRRKIKKNEKKISKNPELKKSWDQFVNEIDKKLAFGDIE